MNRNIIAFGALALLPLAAAAQDITWSVVASEDYRVPMGPLQTNSDRTLDELYLVESGGGRFGFWHGSPDADRGLWAYNGSSYTRYLKFAQAGGNGGPSRTGTEQSHVFLERYSGFDDAASDGRRAFLARAGIPNDTGSQTNGVWSWGGGAASPNREVARAMKDDVLGPGLGPNWYIDGSSGFHQVRALPGGAVLIDATVIDPNTARNEVIFKNVPGVGNVPCALSGSTRADLSPGIVVGDQFSRWSSNSRLRTVDTQGRTYGLFETNGSREGIFELCNGAPRALVVDEEAGNRGPGLTSPNGIFTSFYNGAILGSPGLFSFVAIARNAPGGNAINGVFRNDGTRNRPLALSGDTSGPYAPHWNNSAFTSFNQDTLDASGRYVVFGAAVNASGNSVSGVFRAGASGGPQPIALFNVVAPEYSPGGGLTWTSFYERTVFANGDIVMRARTSADETAIWLFQEGKVARRILGPGSVITMPTTSGNVQVTLSSVDLDSNTAQYASGRNSWAASDGTVLVRAYNSTYGEIWLTAKPSNPNDFIFRDNFGG